MSWLIANSAFGVTKRLNADGAEKLSKVKIH